MNRSRLFALVLGALLLGGCAGATIVARPGVTVAHVHGPGCGHFWGYYAGYPVYYAGGVYTYWDGVTWIHLHRPPVVVHKHRHHQPHRAYVPRPHPPAPPRAAVAPGHAPAKKRHAASPAGR